jgi:hypothetical protein
MEKRGQVLLGSRGGMDGSRRLQSLSQPARQFHCSALAPLFTVCFTHGSPPQLRLRFAFTPLYNPPFVLLQVANICFQSSQRQIIRFSAVSL